MKVSNTQKRLVEMMDALHISQTDIVNRTGVLKSSLSNWVNGRRIPRQDQISAIADPYNIDPAWLMGYDTPMYKELTAKEVYSKYVQELPTDEEMQIIRAYRNSDFLEQQMVLKILKITK